ncbi:MAG: hypothetical protein NTV93_00305 [Verrucomicrobia bacterium]|nr:hypothetical protein [Verrucomicrobiota bacterium]
MSDLLRHFLTALGLEDSPAARAPEKVPAERHALSTDRSTTVFAGEDGDWLNYLRRPWSDRQDGVFEMEILSLARHRLEFSARNPRSVRWAGALTHAFREIQSRLEAGSAAGVFNDMVFGNPANSAAGLLLSSCGSLPALATRETRVNDDLTPAESRILVRTRMFEEFEPLLDSPGTPMERLGKIWEVVRHILLNLGHESYPRDRFTERISLTTNWAMVNLRVLYDGKKDGRLQPGEAGEAFEILSAKRNNIDRRELHAREPFFRLLSDVSFLLRDRNVADLWDTAAVIARDYLDSRYLRLSIAGLMPEKPAWLEAMPVEWKGPRKIKTPRPEIGRYGIIDDEDEDAWKQVRGPLEDIGYLIIGQLGMGQFGRVYEAINVTNGSIPERVAVKVDRIRKGRKKEAIEAADTIMAIARGLSNSPHVIRVFDAGHLKKIRSNYHILQLVEGDTLDHLIGIAGTEHASILRPKSGRSSRDEANREFLKSLSGSASEAWRRERKSPPFEAPPGLSHIMDLLTSTALWLEEVHHLGYAVNDLKNGNVMMSRRGQFKAIDLDSYSRIFSPLDKLSDFFFLAVSSLQLVTRGCGWKKSATASEIKELLADPGAVERRLLEIWPYGDLGAQSDGRISTGDVTGFFARFIDDARSGRFAEEPQRFTDAIDTLIYLKRRLSTEEMVLQ